MFLRDSGGGRPFEANAAYAGLVVALLLRVVVAHPRWSTLSQCENPHETVSWQGWTVGVGCEGTAVSADMLRGPALILFGEELDLNTADVRALEVLPGIGPARAKKIVALRERHPLRSLGDLEEIAGVGPKTIERLRSRAGVGQLKSGEGG